MDLKEIKYKGADWSQLDQGRDQWQALVDTEMIIRVPQKGVKFSD
jgi:hypothetical protein